MKPRYYYPLDNDVDMNDHQGLPTNRIADVQINETGNSNTNNNNSGNTGEQYDTDRHNNNNNNNNNNNSSNHSDDYPLTQPLPSPNVSTSPIVSITTSPDHNDHLNRNTTQINVDIPDPINSAPTNSTSINPASTNPISTNSISTNPVPTNPISPNPITTNPISTNLIPTNPISTNPISTNQFLPFAVDNYGNIGHKGSLFIKHLASRISENTGLEYNVIMARIQSSIGNVINRYNVRMILETMTL